VEATLKIDTSNLNAMHINLPSNHKCLLLAIHKTTAPLPIPILPPAPLMPPPPTLPPTPLTPTPTPLPGAQAPTLPSPQSIQQCKKNCHQLHLPGQKHTCTPEQACSGYAACMHLPFHPEEQKWQQQEKSVERKQKQQAHPSTPDGAERTPTRSLHP
jgi:hypothetical protein